MDLKKYSLNEYINFAIEAMKNKNRKSIILGVDERGCYTQVYVFTEVNQTFDDKKYTANINYFRVYDFHTREYICDYNKDNKSNEILSTNNFSCKLHKGKLLHNTYKFKNKTVYKRNDKNLSTVHSSTFSEEYKFFKTKGYRISFVVKNVQEAKIATGLNYASYSEKYNSKGKCIESTFYFCKDLNNPSTVIEMKSTNKKSVLKIRKGFESEVTINLPDVKESGMDIICSDEIAFFVGLKATNELYNNFIEGIEKFEIILDYYNDQSTLINKANRIYYETKAANMV